MSRTQKTRPVRNQQSTTLRPRGWPARPGRPSPRSSLHLERLEDRTTPSILGTFELDANVTTGVLGSSGSTTTSHDWDQVYADNQTNPVGTTSGALASTFINDAVNTNSDDIFTGGGSKDTLGIQQGRWLFTDSKPQAKNDITQAFAAAYTDPSNGHLILYAGLARFDNSGDATAGFWFFRNKISENPSVTTNGGHPFTGQHTDGDILLVSDFTQGGSTSTIKVFRWTGDDATGSLVALNNGNPIGGNTFAIVNSGPVSVPWSYTNKSGQSSPAAGEFLEEGVDLTALGLDGCFSAFMAETRSSQSPTATLSDFVVGNFPLCSVTGIPGSPGLSKATDTFTYALKVKNTGAGGLYLQNVTDTLLGNLVQNGVVQTPVAPVTGISLNGFDPTTTLGPGQTLTISVSRVMQATDPDPVSNTTTFVFNDEPDFSSDTISDTVTNTVNLFQPSATMSVTASPTTATALGQVITYTYTVNNTSSSDSPNLVLSTSNPNNSFTDTLLGNLEADAIAAGGGSVAPGASFTFTETRAIQAGDPTPLTNTATVVFTLAQNLGPFSNQITAQDSSSVTLLPHLTITKVVTSGSPDVIHPGDTASFTITVTNDGAGPATNVLVQDQLPAADLLTWGVDSSTFGTTSISTSDFLTASSSSLPAGATASVTVSAVIPLDIFGSTTSGGTGNLPNGPFELDGNATTTTTHDWDQVFADVVNGTGTSGAFAHSFVTDAVNTTSDDIFTGGGSKDTRGIQQGPWLFTDSKPQAKNDITHAYAAMYTDPSNGHVILYAGLDRFDNSGDATAGFWFFTNSVGLSTNNPTSSGSPFVGTHADGDILLVSDFTQGGSTSTIKVFRWTGNDATGSLVAVTAPTGTTFARVNGSAITVPWSFQDKSHNSGPAAGEFLEEGVDLTALGLGGCFSNFMAETRSSQSPTATLSDFVLGSFNTCRLDLPNSATVQADGIPPISSDTVTITVVDGDEFLAESPGSGAADSLTAEQLQAAVARAITEWRAAGVDAQRLSALDRVTVHLANLPGNELGFASPGEIWIDRTAAGWGWSLDGAPGTMDLTTVLTHEFGHALGFGHESAGVMEAALAPGMQLAPAALPVTTSVAPVAPTSPAIGTSEVGAARTSVSPAALVHTEATEVTFATAGRAAAVALQESTGQRSLTGVTTDHGQPASVILSGTTTTTTTGADRVPAARVDGGGGDSVLPSAEGLDALPADRVVPMANPGDMPSDPNAAGPNAVGSWEGTCDACFADGSWMAGLEGVVTPLTETIAEYPAPASGSAAAAALALALGGYWSAPRAEVKPRARRRLVI